MTKNMDTSIQREQRVLHSILGAFWGWLSTFIIFMFLIPILSGGIFTFGHDWSLLIYLVAIGVVSFFITFAGWFCLGFPIAALISDRQARSFKFMIPIHTIATELVIAVMYLLSWLFGSEKSCRILDCLAFLLNNPFSIVAASIGIIGGAVFCALERRNKSWQR